MEKKQTYDEFIKKNHKEIKKKKDLIKKQSEQECKICDEPITEFASIPGICKSCENKAINGEDLGYEE